MKGAKFFPLIFLVWAMQAIAYVCETLTLVGQNTAEVSFSNVLTITATQQEVFDNDTALTSFDSVTTVITIKSNQENGFDLVISAAIGDYYDSGIFENYFKLRNGGGDELPGYIHQDKLADGTELELFVFNGTTAISSESFVGDKTECREWYLRIPQDQLFGANSGTYTTTITATAVAR